MIMFFCLLFIHIFSIFFNLIRLGFVKVFCFKYFIFFSSNFYKFYSFIREFNGNSVSIFFIFLLSFFNIFGIFILFYFMLKKYIIYILVFYLLTFIFHFFYLYFKWMFKGCCFEDVFDDFYKDPISSYFLFLNIFSLGGVFKFVKRFSFFLFTTFFPWLFNIIFNFFSFIRSIIIFFVKPFIIVFNFFFIIIKSFFLFLHSIFLKFLSSQFHDKFLGLIIGYFYRKYFLYFDFKKYFESLNIFLYPVIKPSFFSSLITFFSILIIFLFLSYLLGFFCFLFSVFVSYFYCLDSFLKSFNFFYCFLIYLFVFIFLLNILFFLIFFIFIYFVFIVRLYRELFNLFFNFSLFYSSFFLGFFYYFYNIFTKEVGDLKGVYYLRDEWLKLDKYFEDDHSFRIKVWEAQEKFLDTLEKKDSPRVFLFKKTLKNLFIILSSIFIFVTLFTAYVFF